jgi:hypothetical protein
MRILGTIASSSREVPNAPTIGTATDVGTGRTFTPQNGGGTVTFTAPTFTGGLPILDYTATSSPGSFTATGAGSPLTVNGLAPNTNYTFTVRARNAVGSSTASSASNSILSTTVPQAPTIGTATDGGTGTTVSVAFTGNATGGKAISSYTVTSSPGGFTTSGASSPLTVSGLTAGTAYTFTATASNANGVSGASSPSNSVTPATPSSFESIATFNGTGSSGIITFSSIPQTYKSLQIRGISRLTSGTIAYPISLTINGATSGYSWHYIQGNGTSASSGSSTGATNIQINKSAAGNTVAANVMGVSIVDIVDYASTSKNKTLRYFSGVDANTGATSFGITLGSGLYPSTTAITSITLNAGFNFATTSTIALYGVK